MTKSIKIPDKLYYKVGEVCKIAGIQSYVLKYWETEFPQLTSDKQEGGQKVYARGELETVLHIKKLLYEDGFTISGAKKQLEKEGLAEAAPDPEPSAESLESAPEVDGKQRAAIEEVLSELKALRDKLAND
jgi:DNA-binding transcriptional MerR regulator